MLIALISSVRCSKEAHVETDDQRLFALCEDQAATPEAIQTLLETGVSLEARDEGSYTPLMVASAASSTPVIIDTLLAAGADIHARDADGGLCKPHRPLRPVPPRTTVCPI